jgi:hypothetical protein
MGALLQEGLADGTVGRNITSTLTFTIIVIITLKVFNSHFKPSQVFYELPAAVSYRELNWTELNWTELNSRGKFVEDLRRLNAWIDDYLY